jgi:uncharacterized protein DUF4167
VRAASVDAADGGATLDNSCGYHQILLSRVVGRGRLNQFVPEIVIIFSGQPTSSIGHEQRWRPLHQILILRAPPGAYFISRYQGRSHTEDGPKTVMSTRQPKPAGSFPARPKRWTSSTTRTQLHGGQSAQRSYERYLELAQEEARSGNAVAAENYYQHAEHYFRLMSSNRKAT